MPVLTKIPSQCEEEEKVTVTLKMEAFVKRGKANLTISMKSETREPETMVLTDFPRHADDPMKNLEEVVRLFEISDRH